MSNLDEPVGGGPLDGHGLAPLAIDHDPRYVLGFPLHVAITLCASHPGTTLRRLPRPSWSGNAGAIGVRLTRADTGAEVVNAEPWPVVRHELGTPTFNLRAGTCRRCLIDVSSFLPAGVAPGRYQLTIIYVAPPHRTESPAVAIELASPSPDELEELDRLRPELVHEGSWGRWTSMPPEPGNAPLTDRIDPSDPLRFDRVVKYMLYGPKPLSEIDPSLIDVLHGVYEPESHALRAELAAARSDAASFAEQAALIRSRYPALDWWIDRIEAGCSEIAFVRSNRVGACEPE